MVVRLRNRFGRDPVGPRRPAGQILQFAPLAAERPPLGLDRVPPAEHAQHTPIVANGELPRLIERVMADVAGRNDENHVLGDVCRVIADPLEMP